MRSNPDRVNDEVEEEELPKSRMRFKLEERMLDRAAAFFSTDSFLPLQQGQCRAGWKGGIGKGRVGVVGNSENSNWEVGVVGTY